MIKGEEKLKELQKALSKIEFTYFDQKDITTYPTMAGRTEKQFRRILKLFSAFKTEYDGQVHLDREQLESKTHGKHILSLDSIARKKTTIEDFEKLFTKKDAFVNGFRLGYLQFGKELLEVSGKEDVCECLRCHEDYSSCICDYSDEEVSRKETSK